MEKDYNENVKKIIEEINNLIEILDSYGFELNDDGDIIDKKTKKLVFDYGSDKNE